MMRLTDPSMRRARCILVVEDDDATRAEFVLTLKNAGYDVLEAMGAAQALRILLAERPDAVLLDLVLPDGHGIEVGRAMRAITTTQRTCVVAVTDPTHTHTLLDPRSFGAESILVKPVSEQLLLDTVARCFPEDDFVFGAPAPRTSLETNQPLS